MISWPQYQCRVRLSVPPAHIPHPPLNLSSRVDKLPRVPGTPLAWGPCPTPVTPAHSFPGAAEEAMLACQSTPVQDERQAKCHVSRNPSWLITGGSSPRHPTLVAPEYESWGSSAPAVLIYCSTPVSWIINVVRAPVNFPPEVPEFPSRRGNTEVTPFV